MSESQKEYTAEELRTMHQEEAANLGWRCIFNGGEVPGDLNVSILPPAYRVSHENKSRLYVYRRNMLTGKFTLARKIT